VEIDETLGLIERGRLTVPEGVTARYFFAAGGSSPADSAGAAEAEGIAGAGRKLQCDAPNGIASRRFGACSGLGVRPWG
jgi:hypothetical protein